MTDFTIALALGFSAFPCNPGTAEHAKIKSPLTKNGYKDATSNFGLAKSLFGSHQNPLVGVPTGIANDLYVLDIDEKNNVSGEASLSYLQIALNSSWQVKTPSGGRHIYFKGRPGLPKLPNKAGNILGPGVDFRGDGGYVIFPPSKSRDGIYQFINGFSPTDRALEEIPEFLINTVTGQNSISVTGFSETAPIQTGTRNNTLFKKASNLRQLGLEHDELMSVIKSENEKKCDVPLSEGELETIIASVTNRQTSRRYESNDYGNASRFVDHAHGKIVFCKVSKKWMCIDKYRLKPIDRTPYDVVKSSLIGIKDEILSQDNPGELLSWYKKSQNVQRLDACLKIASNDERLCLNLDHVDSIDHHISTRNGVVDLKDKKLVDQPMNLHMLQTTASFETDARCPRFIEFISEICGDDSKMIHNLQKAIGYSFSGDTRYQVMFLCNGTGANGKSTLFDVLSKVLGTYSGRISSKAISNENANRIPNDLAALKGKRFVVVTELPEKMKLNTVMLKELTGNDLLIVRFLYSEYFQYKPKFKLWLSSNFPFRFNEEGYAIDRRVVEFDFQQEFSGARRNLIMDRELLKESEGILNWAIEGYSYALKEGFETNADLKKASNRNPDFDLFKRHFDAEVILNVENQRLSLEKLTQRIVERFQVPGKQQITLTPLQVKKFMEKLGFHTCRMRDGNKRYDAYRNMQLIQHRCPF